MLSSAIAGLCQSCTLTRWLGNLTVLRSVLRRTMQSGEPAHPMYNVIFVLGGPGSGKGTQCSKIAAMTNNSFVHLSAGELLRRECDTPNSLYGDKIQTHIADGTIVPVAITCALLNKAMETSGQNNFLIDGFPRNKDNLDGWNTAMNKVADVKFVLFFKCPRDVCVRRCLDRGRTSGRTDDNEESLCKRFETYVNQTMPIIDHYSKLGLVREVQADRPQDEIFADVKKFLQQMT